MQNFKLYIICASLLLIFPLSLSAHTTGASWEQVVGKYKLDVGYDPTVFLTGSTVRFDFKVFDAQTGQPVDFSDVWVRISQSQQTVFASGIHKVQLGATGMIFTFPKEGDYNLNVRFENGDANLAEASFPIQVAAAEVSGARFSLRAQLLIAGMSGIFLGALCNWLYLKKTKKE